MADYQHVLAVHADAAQRKKRKWADMEPQLQKSGIFDLDQDDLIMLLPPCFSAKDTPEQVVLKSSSKGKKPAELVQHFSHPNFLDIQQRIFFVDFSVEDVPKVIEWEKFTARNSYQRECQMALCKLFDERPVWPKLSVAECLRDDGFKIQHNLLRRLLFNAAYYFLNGPFRRFWIRRGYDPRKDPGTCIYQRIDFRVPPSLRGYCDANAEMKYEQKWADLCAFKCFPYGCQISLQLCELDDDYIQQEIRKPVKESTCSRAAGWFSVPMISNLRRKIKVRFLSVCPDPEAENLLKTCRNMFEKTKMNLIEGDLRPDKSLDKQAHKEIMVDEETEDNQQATKDVLPDEEADDDELDDDEDDEEYGEAIGISGEEDEIPLQPGTYENISASYLRNIFGTFPSDEPGSSKFLGRILGAAEKIGGKVLEVTKVLAEAFSVQELLVKIKQSQKPDIAGLAEFLKPLNEVIMKASALAEGRRTDFFNHLKAASDSLSALAWIAYTGKDCGMSMPIAHVEESWQSAEFYNNKPSRFVKPIVFCVIIRLSPFLMFNFMENEPNTLAWCNMVHRYLWNKEGKTLIMWSGPRLAKALKELYLPGLRDYVKAFYPLGPVWSATAFFHLRELEPFPHYVRALSSPTISVDNTSGCQLYLSKESMGTSITTAKSSEINVLVPASESDSDWVRFLALFVLVNIMNVPPGPLCMP
ncbi:hypothetical protein QQ045_012252 [Rhodiola kirilowii]